MFNDIDEIKDFLVLEAEYEEEEVEKMKPFDILDAWLTYNRIDGLAEDIINVIELAYGVDLN